MAQDDALAGVSLGGASQLPGDTCLRHMLLGVRWAGVEGGGGTSYYHSQLLHSVFGTSHSHTCLGAVAKKLPKKETTAHK